MWFTGNGRGTETGTATDEGKVGVRGEENYVGKVGAGPKGKG